MNKGDVVCVYIYIYIYIMENYSAMKKDDITPFAVTWMGLEMITLSEVSQRKTTISQYHLYVESKQ